MVMGGRYVVEKSHVHNPAHTVDGRFFCCVVLDHRQLRL